MHNRIYRSKNLQFKDVGFFYWHLTMSCKGSLAGALVTV